MARKSRADAAQAAANQSASEAGRILQAQRQPEPVEPAASPEPAPKSDAPRPPARNERRRQGMEEIEQREARERGEDKPETKAPEVVAEKPAEVVAESVPEAPAPEAVAEPAPPKTVKVKIDGEESEVPEEEIEAYGGVKAYQIQKASENRLKKANEALEATRKTQAQLAEYMMRQQAPKEAPKAPTDILKEKMDVIRWGTPEESAAAFQEVLSSFNKPVDENQLTSNVMAAVNRQNAVNRFKTEFADIVGNPIVFNAAKALEQHKYTEMQGNIPDWENFYRSIGNEVRNAFGRPHQPASDPKTGNTSLSAKEEKKASIVNLPTAAARAELPKEEKPETREEMLLKMKKARGLPTG